MLELRSEQPASKVCAEVIDDRHDQIEGEKQREQAVFQEQTDGDLDLLAQAAGPDIPQDDRLPDVHLPEVEGCRSFREVTLPPYRLFLDKLNWKFLSFLAATSANKVTVIWAAIQ